MADVPSAIVFAEVFANKLPVVIITTVKIAKNRKYFFIIL